jgi:hypothetical protein
MGGRNWANQEQIRAHRESLEEVSRRLRNRLEANGSGHYDGKKVGGRWLVRVSYAINLVGDVWCIQIVRPTKSEN